MSDEERVVLLSRRSLIRNGLLLATGAGWVPSVFSAVQPAQQTSGAGVTGNSWTISNDRIARTVAFREETGFVTERFSDLVTHTDFILPGNIRRELAPEFSFLCNGRLCTGASASFDLVDASKAALAHGTSLTVRLRHKEMPLEVAAVYSVYEGHPAIRKHLELRNSGESALHVSHLNIEAIGLDLGSSDEVTLLTQYGAIPRETFYTGRVEDAGLLVANGLTGNGMAVLSEVPGCMKRTEINGFYDENHVQISVMYDTDLMPFERAVARGESFTTANVSLVAFRKMDGFNDPHWVLPSYTAQVLERRVDAQGPPWIYNTWEPFEEGINSTIVMELIDIAGAIGLDVFAIDDGWQTDYGENTVNTAAFPGGLKPILDAVEARGMRLGLWMPMAAIGTSTATYRKHPEWAALDQKGNPKITITAAGPKAVMCMATAYRDTVVERAVDAIARFRLGYLKFDLTAIFNAYGEAPGCSAKDHYHENWSESLNRIYEGISYVTHKIYDKHPDVLIDLTFELWGQKHVIDAGLLSAGDLDWISNVGDQQPDSAGPLQARQLLYQRAASMPVEAMLIGNLRAEMQPIRERFATAIGAAPVLLGDLRRLNAADRSWYRQKIDWFKKLRRSTRISESFFPLGSWLQTTLASWDGFARFARSGDGVIVLFRNKSHATEAMVKLPLLPDGKYKLLSIITGKTLEVIDSSAWTRGVPIHFDESETVEILDVTSVHG